MGCVAVGRIMLLAPAYPLGNIVWKRESLRFAMPKWKVILVVDRMAKVGA